ncbi:MAG: hypothetical protein JW838_04065 [Spirochaetes bacterium]|nr:hypothetical protein [Spirochaetota bacterium]
MNDDRAFPWGRLAMKEENWRKLAAAFYDLAHNDFRKFEGLPRPLKDHPVGKLCAKYMETGEHEYVEKAGRELTGTDEWYVYLGR